MPGATRLSVTRDGERAAGRQSPTLTLTLPLPRTLADLCWPGRSLAHVSQACEHSAQAHNSLR